MQKAMPPPPQTIRITQDLSKLPTIHLYNLQTIHELLSTFFNLLTQTHQLEAPQLQLYYCYLHSNPKEPKRHGSTITKTISLCKQSLLQLPIQLIYAIIKDYTDSPISAQSHPPSPRPSPPSRTLPPPLYIQDIHLLHHKFSKHFT
eukprot:GHVP01049405.1.p1 GENE.GHVP01049405.1~~GHVP01049405.1.p1  ORF type:complete len:146 (-),score=7.85 GHVP01049405.1:702-1139(-)